MSNCAKFLETLKLPDKIKAALESTFLLHPVYSNKERISWSSLGFLGTPHKVPYGSLKVCVD